MIRDSKDTPAPGAAQTSLISRPSATARKEGGDQSPMMVLFLSLTETRSLVRAHSRPATSTVWSFPAATAVTAYGSHGALAQGLTGRQKGRRGRRGGPNPQAFTE